MEFIDAHAHFWNIEGNIHSFDRVGQVCKTFLPSHYTDYWNESGSSDTLKLHSIVHIEVINYSYIYIYISMVLTVVTKANPISCPMEEVKWLLNDLPARGGGQSVPSISAIVAYADLSSESQIDEEFRAFQSVGVKGIRQILNWDETEVRE